MDTFFTALSTLAGMKEMRLRRSRMISFQRRKFDLKPAEFQMPIEIGKHFIERGNLNLVALLEVQKIQEHGLCRKFS
jgi:hypothetical protein